MSGGSKLAAEIMRRVDEATALRDAEHEPEGPAWFTCPGRKPGRWGTNTCWADHCRGGERCEIMARRGLDGEGRPLPLGERPACRARSRAGHPCRQKVVPGKRRCRFHGGLSTGPKTEEGRQRVIEALCRYRAALREAEEAQDRLNKMASRKIEDEVDRRRPNDPRERERGWRSGREG